METVITCTTHKNGYALDLGNHHYFYQSVAKLLIGAAWHILHDFTEYVDLDEVVEVMSSKERIEYISSVNVRMHSLQENNLRLKETNARQRQKISELNKELKEYKKNDVK